ncbi:MAG: hypothetical protein ACLP8X_06775 [Streptosporangiaceae bacterium]
MTNHRIALIPGDGIGTEVLPPARQILDAVGRRHGFGFSSPLGHRDRCDFP